MIVVKRRILSETSRCEASSGLPLRGARGIYLRMSASIRARKRRSQERGPSRHYRPMKGTRWSLGEDRLWAAKRAAQRQFFEDVAAGRVKTGAWLSAGRVSSATLSDQAL